MCRQRLQIETSMETSQLELHVEETNIYSLEKRGSIRDLIPIGKEFFQDI